MSAQVHPLGLGESLGDDLIINGPLVHTGQVWWVSSDTGSDAASPRGLERARPLATLAQAVSNAAAGDIIVLMDGHSETISSAVAVNKRLVIVGSGQASGIPTVQLSVTGNIEMLSITATQVELRNIRFLKRVTASANTKIDAGSDGFRMIGCYVECGDNDTGPGVRLTGNYSSVRGTTFLSVATAASSAPDEGLRPVADFGPYIDDCVFDGGEHGWLNGWAIDQDGEGGPVTGFRAQNLSLLRGSDVRLHDTCEAHVLANVGSYAPRIDFSGAEGVA